MSAKDYELILCKDGYLYINKRDGNDFRSEDSKILSKDDIAEIAKWYKKQTEPTNEDLEKEMQHYFCKEWAGDPVAAARHFANWQKQRIMKDALTAQVIVVEDFMGTTTFRCMCDKFKVGEKVKVIFLKEE